MVKKNISIGCLILVLLISISCTSKVQEIPQETPREETIGKIEETASLPKEPGPLKEEDNKPLEERHWKRVFSKAFQTVDCPAPRDPKSLPDGFYKGPMIDTHIHIQSLPDGAPGFPDDYYVGDNLGIKRSMDEWACMLDYEGTKQAWGFFPVWEPIIQESVYAVKTTMGKYPNKFVPFIMPPDRNDPTVDAEKLKEMLELENGMFQGYGEIGLYGNPDSPPLPPDSQTLTDIYPVVRKHGLIVYLHLGEGHKEALERAAAANPDITFVFHGDQLIDCAECDKTHNAVADILENNPNVYYGVDELYGGDWLLKPGESKEAFLAQFNDYGLLFEKDIARFKEFIESHPDQVLWGTDRGVSNSWDTDPEVALAMNNYTRAFIGKLDASVQEKLAYKNAEKLLQNPEKR